METGQEQIDINSPTPAGPTAAGDPVCNRLLENGRLKEGDLKRAVSYRDQHGGDLVTLLVRLGLVSERDVAEAEAELLDLPLVRTADLPDQVPELPDVSVRFLKQIVEPFGVGHFLTVQNEDPLVEQVSELAQGK